MKQQPDPILPESPGACIPLEQGTSLHRRYTIRQVTGFDKCTITYAGFDFQAHQPVSIIEFFPQDLAMRALSSGVVSPKDRESGALYFLASEAFLTQYGALTQAIGSPNILSVFDAFFENGTAYAITEPMEGVSLADYPRIKKRPLNEGELTYVANAMADALLIVHSLNILHQRITAKSIRIGTDGTIKLTNFSAAHETISTGRDVSGRAPYTDIRALGDTLYALLPNGQHSQQLMDMLERMRTPNPRLRFDTVFDLRYCAASLDLVPLAPKVSVQQIAGFLQSKASASGVQPQKEPEQQQKQTQGASRPGLNTRHLTVGICILLLALVITLIVMLIRR